MALILAIEPDERQAAQLTDVISRRVSGELVLAESTEQALAAIGDRVPDLVLIPMLLSPQEDAALAGALRAIATAGRVQMLTIPVLAETSKPSKKRGVLAQFRRSRAGSPNPDGCDPTVFGDQIAAYLAEAAMSRDADEPASVPSVAPPIDDVVIAPSAGDVATQVDYSAPAAEWPAEMALRSAGAPIAVLIDESIPAALDEPIPIPAAPSMSITIAESSPIPIIESITVPLVAPLIVPSGESVTTPLPEPSPVVEPIAVSIAEPLPVVEPITLAVVEPIWIDQPIVLLTEDPVAEPVGERAANLIKEPSTIPIIESVATPIEHTVTHPIVELFAESEEPAVYEMSLDEWAGDAASMMAINAMMLPIGNAAAPVPAIVDPPVLSPEPVAVIEQVAAEEPPAVVVEPPRLAAKEEVAVVVAPLVRAAEEPVRVVAPVVVVADDPMAVRVELAAAATPIIATPPTVSSASAHPAVDDDPGFFDGSAAETSAMVDRPAVAPKPKRHEWIELVESLRLDLERQKVERAALDAATREQPTPAVAAAVARNRRALLPQLAKNLRPATSLRGRARKKPVQNEWGLFDPEQCGFAALLAKLDEITHAK